MNTVAAVQAARAVQRRLLDWLLNAAYPVWSTRGVDRLHGGFEELLGQDGASVRVPRRARVPPRQIYAFAHSVALGWSGDGAGLVQHGLRYFLEHYRRADGLYRTLVAPDGTALDDSVRLYDQAFALLAFASAHRLSDHDGEIEREAERLLAALQRDLRHGSEGFDSGLPERAPLLSNPHMHLLESCLEWRDLSANPVWGRLADEIATLALVRFIDPRSGALRETFDADWSPASGVAGRLVEPGHQFEWAWLLMRWRGKQDPAARRAARRLIDIGEEHGVRHGVAIDGLLDDLSVHADSARLWPQTERLKAAALAAQLSGETRYWHSATAAALGLMSYFETPIAGLWHDRRSAEGVFLPGGAPAGNLYHIVAAVLAFTAAVASVPPADGAPPSSSAVAG